MAIDLNIELTSSSELDVQMTSQPDQVVSLEPGTGIGTRNYNNLTNRPSINDVTLAGNKTAEDLKLVSENTERGWEANRTYLPKFGEICLYTDLGRIKIGDGVVPLIDLPFINDHDYDTVMSAIQNHTANNFVHVTLQDRAFWDAKLNYTIAGEELILTRN